jgi:hypothetical protein
MQSSSIFILSLFALISAASAQAPGAPTLLGSDDGLTINVPGNQDVGTFE